MDGWREMERGREGRQSATAPRVALRQRAMEKERGDEREIYGQVWKGGREGDIDRQRLGQQLMLFQLGESRTI